MIVELSLAAELELEDAIAYLEKQRTGLGLEFAREVDAALSRIEEHPHAWQKLSGDVRRYQLRRFRYGLVYRVHGGIATVYAIMHLKRRPGYWRDRVK